MVLKIGDSHLFWEKLIGDCPRLVKTYAIDSITNRYDENTNDNIHMVYDDAGNTTTDQDGYLYTWDYENRIVNIKDSSDNDVVDYTYDALGRRIRKIDMPGHSTLESTTLYWYNNNWQVLAETDGADSLERIFLYGNYIDEVLIHQEVANSYQLYYQLQDHLYSSVALLDQNNTVVQRVEYDSYGKPSKLNDNYTTFSGTDTGNPYCFTGRRVDVIDSGDKVLQYSRNRYLDYETGRWLSHDPLGYVDTLNMYEYVISNPLSYTDPYGLQLTMNPCALAAAGFTPAEIAVIKGTTVAAVMVALKKCPPKTPTKTPSRPRAPKYPPPKPPKSDKHKKCEALYGAYKAIGDAIKCSGCDTPWIRVGKTTVLLSIAAGRLAYLEMRCDRVFGNPPSAEKGHWDMYNQVQGMIVKCWNMPMCQKP
ncbi:MAG: RHS repeat-associated core domain-containing protein [Phycisphaerae bacterium]|nr:RHS repeat-associated core domain-containing protein [Phycisphaerae bacterium]